MESLKLMGDEALNPSPAPCGGYLVLKLASNNYQNDRYYESDG